MLFFSKSIFLVDFLEGIVDIHNHILPGIDDGSPNIETTLDMARAMKELGIKSCIATPHTMEDYYGNDVVSITDNYKSTTNALEATDCRGFIKQAASEYMMDGKFENIIKTDYFLCIYKNYILTELSYFQRPNNLEELVFEMCKKGLIPILAHPERYRYLKSVNEFKGLKERGFEFQLNLLSLTEHYGEDAQMKAFSFLEKGMYDFIGTDAHKVSHLEKIKTIKIKKKQVPEITKLVENHKLCFNL